MTTTQETTGNATKPLIKCGELPLSNFSHVDRETGRTAGTISPYCRQAMSEGRSTAGPNRLPGKRRGSRKKV